MPPQERLSIISHGRALVNRFFAFVSTGPGVASESDAQDREMQRVDDIEEPLVRGTFRRARVGFLAAI